MVQYQKCNLALIHDVVEDNKIIFQDPYASLNPVQKIQDAIIEPLKYHHAEAHIGAILRSCDASNVDLVILTNEKCDIYNPNVIRSSVGTFFSNKIVSMENESALNFLKNKGFKIYGTSLNASKKYNSISYNCSTAIISGSENNGISEFWSKNSDELIKIPMLGMADSLNVSVSSAICLFEVNRQFKFNR